MREARLFTFFVFSEARCAYVFDVPPRYRTLVYALAGDSIPQGKHFLCPAQIDLGKVECESQSARDFGTRCLLALLEKYEGVSTLFHACELWNILNPYLCRNSC